MRAVERRQENPQIPCAWIASCFPIRHCLTFVLRIYIFTFLHVYSHITPIIIAVFTPCTVVNKAERVYFNSKQKDENSLGTKKRDMISWNKKKNQSKISQNSIVTLKLKILSNLYARLPLVTCSENVFSSQCSIMRTSCKRPLLTRCDHPPR